MGIHIYIHSNYLEIILTSVIVIHISNCCKHGSEKLSKELLTKNYVSDQANI